MSIVRPLVVIALLSLAGCGVVGTCTCKPPPDPAEPNAVGPAMPTPTSAPAEGGF